MTPPDSASVSIQEQGSAVMVRMAPKRGCGLLAALSFWLLGWIIGEAAIIGDLNSFIARPDWRWAAWYGVLLVLWSAAGLVSLWFLLFRMAGHELLTVKDGEVSHQFKLGPVSLWKTRRFPAASLRTGELRVISERTKSGRTTRFYQSSVLVNDKPLFFGNGLPEEEAQALLAYLKTRY